MRMKHKKLFFEPWIMYLAGPLYCFSEFPIAIYMAWESVSKMMSGDFRYMFTLLFSPAFAFCGVYLYKNMIGDRLDFLAVSSQCVRWIAFFKRSKKLCFDQCTFIGIETFNKEGHRAIIRGDENAMIYFTTEPYPEEFRGRINHVHCSDTFIKFRYTDELARTLLEVLPEEKKPAIQAFYNQMQNRDYERQKAIRAWKNNRARQKREKERRKQKKG